MRILRGTRHGIATVQITGADLLVASLEASDPTVVYGDQSEFSCTSWTSDSYQRAGVLKVKDAGWPAATVGKTLLTATLAVYRKSGFINAGVGTLFAKEMLRNWVSPTWNIFSTGNNWQTAGAMGASDVTATPVSSVALTDSTGYFILPHSAALLAMLQAQKDGLNNYGCLLHCGFFDDFNNFDGPAGANPPVVTLTYIP